MTLPQSKQTSGTKAMPKTGQTKGKTPGKGRTGRKNPGRGKNR